MKIDRSISPAKLRPAIDRFLDLSARKILSIDRSWDPADGTPVFTRAGRRDFNTVVPSCSTT